MTETLNKTSTIKMQLTWCTKWHPNSTNRTPCYIRHYQPRLKFQELCRIC